MTPEEREERLAVLREQRRRDRWGALLKPFVTLSLFLAAITFCMYLIKSCQDRNQNRAFPRLPIQREPAPPAPIK
jgi:hypothetical protein